MLNIVVPMAGHGSRFAKAGYKDPKPLIPVCGRPMIGLVIENLAPRMPHRFTFICQRAHLESYPLGEALRAASPGCRIIAIDGVTEGAACTVLLARDAIDNRDPLMVANCDQYVDARIDDYLASMDRSGLDGLIMTMTADDPKWSFVSHDERGRVSLVVEKQVVSDEATVGIYNYREGRMFVRAAEEMIRRGERVNNEFYVAPAYNEMIETGLDIGFHNIGRDRDGMYGLGTPEDLDYFKSTAVARRISGLAPA